MSLLTREEPHPEETIHMGWYLHYTLWTLLITKVGWTIVLPAEAAYRERDKKEKTNVSFLPIVDAGLATLICINSFRYPETAFWGMPLVSVVFVASLVLSSYLLALLVQHVAIRLL